MKKTIVKCSDYEFYRIFLPWKYIFSHRKNFIVGELEKMHPRFSGNCCYDTKYSIEKRNLLAEVVVMEKSNLAQYKNSGGKLYLESEKNRNVFSGRTKIIHALSLVLIMLTGIFSFRIAKSLIAPESPAVEEICEQIFEDENVLSSEEKAVSDSESLVFSVFASVSSHGGKISMFSYNRNDSLVNGKSGGLCTFSIYGCNCEDVANAQYCVVSFKDNEPHFEMVLPFHCELPAEKILSDEKITAGQEISAVVAIRTQLRDLGAVFEQERNGDEAVEFSFFARREILYSCLKIASVEAENALWAEKFISVSEKGGMCKVKLAFLKNRERDSFSPLQVTAQYAYLFGSEIKLAKKPKNLFQISPVSSELSLASKNKIGEIKKKDGSVLVCYRNSDGRMAFEKKEVVNAN